MTAWSVAHSSAMVGFARRKCVVLRAASTCPIQSRIMIPTHIRPHFASTAASQSTFTILEGEASHAPRSGTDMGAETFSFVSKICLKFTMHVCASLRTCLG